jgi:hypothetical protein
MGRLIGSVIVGYLVIFVAVFATFSAAYVAIGADGAFRPGSYDVSMTWIILGTVLSFGAAWLGGRICLAIAKDAKGPKALAAVVLILGILFAIPAMKPPPSEPRPAGAAMMDAMQRARTPLWVALLNPVIGVLGVLVGGRRRDAAG